MDETKLLNLINEAVWGAEIANQTVDEYLDENPDTLLEIVALAKRLGWSATPYGVEKIQWAGMSWKGAVENVLYIMWEKHPTIQK